MPDSKPPKVFVSYAWEDDIKTWVLDFATRLRSDGINAILDQWETVPGDQLTEFMEKSVRESDFVVFVCTPTYKRKSDRRKGGVGYEGSIITGEVFAKNNHRKFIPVLRKGKWVSAAPSWATSKLFIDLRSDPYSEMYYQQLLNTLFRKSPPAPPVWNDTLREIAKREAAEKAEHERLELEAAEKAAQEKANREKAEKEDAEKARLEAEEQAKLKAEQEKADQEASENAERERIAREEREKKEREASKKAAQQKIENEIQREYKKMIKKAKRDLWWRKLKIDIQYRLELMRIYRIPTLILLVALVIIVPLLIDLSNKFPELSQALNNSTITMTSQPVVPSKTIELGQTLPQSVTFAPTSLPTEITDDKGIEMVLVLAGKFSMGSDSGTNDEKPAHDVYLDAYYIDKYEVTNARYKICVTADVCQEPGNTSNFNNSYYANRPVVSVDWSQASLYCEWRGGSLPTEAQWEKAARGIDGREYPWGDGIDCDKAQYNVCGFQTTDVGTHESGKSPYGVYDMSGNAWEWVADWYSATYYENSPSTNPDGPLLGDHRVLRGGAWSSSEDRLQVYDRGWYDVALYMSSVGFRCTKDANP